MSHLESGSVVWVRLGQAWWPGTITTIAKCPPEFVQAIRKTPIAIVKFFHENEYQDVHKEEHIFAYNCDRKEEFIRKGQMVNKNQSHGDVDLLAKFEADVVTAEKLTGGDMDILRTLVEGAGKRRIDYSDLGFGPPKPKKKRDDGTNRQGSDIGQAVVYKRLGGRGGGRGRHRVVIEHRVRIMEQPHRENMEEDMRAAASWFKCQQCGFTCTRLNVIVWHNKAHLSKVCNYDSGIKLPGRRRRRPGASRGGRDGRKKGKERKGKENLDHAHTNGDVPGGGGGGKKDLQDTQQILMDWDDEDDGAGGGDEPGSPQDTENKKDMSDGGYSDADDDYPPPQPRYERRPMPKAADLNSAFDALLAATNTHSNLNTSSSSATANNYVNNDSDSDYSDWEKYYARGSGSGSEEEEEVEQESDIKSLCEGSTGEGGSGQPGEDERVDEETGSMDEGRGEEPQQKQKEQEPEKMEAASPTPVSVEGISSPAKVKAFPCPDQTPEPELDQQQKEDGEPDVEDSRELDEPQEEALEVEEVTENMEMEEGLSNPPECCEEEVATEPPQDEEELAMTTEEVEYYEEPEKNSSDAVQDLANSDVIQQAEDLEVATDCTDLCQEDEKQHASSPEAKFGRDEKKQPTPTQPSSRGSGGDQPENTNRLGRYIDEFSETMVAKEEEVVESSMECSREHHQSVEATSSPRPVHTGQDGPVSASPVRTGDPATTSNSGTTYMLVAVDAHGNTVPTVPTPALSEGGNDLVAVEATMEDGTTRTLYIDPAQLGPNVDLSNLMLHIDTSGQEHVIIPSSSSSDSEGPSSRPAPSSIHYSPGHVHVHGDSESALSPREPSHSHAQRHGDSDS